MQNHGQPLHTQAQVHHRIGDIVLREGNGRVDAEGGHLHPAAAVLGGRAHQAGMIGKDLNLGSRGVVLAPLLVRPELELLESELAEQAIRHRLAVLYAHLFVHDHTAGGVVAHQPGRILRLLPAEAAVHGE